MSKNITDHHNTISRDLNVAQLADGHRRLRWIIATLLILLVAISVPVAE